MERKAISPDGISMELIKYGGTLLLWRLLHLLNECWQTSQVPESRKTAEVISLSKKGDCSECKKL